MVMEANKNPPTKYVSSTIPTTKLQQTTVTFMQEAPISLTSLSHSRTSSTTVKQLDFVTFTTSQKPFRNDQLRGVTSPEYLPPRQLLPIENENRPFAPIPLPNLSMTPIPPLHEAQSFLYDPYKNFMIGTKFIPTYSNGTKYIENITPPHTSKGLNFKLPQEMPLYLSTNIATKPSSSNVEIIESFPIVEFQQTTIEDSFNAFKTTTSKNSLQYTTTSRPIESTQSSLLNIYHSQLILSDGSTSVDSSRKTPINFLDAPIIHFNKSETNVLPVIVTFQNVSTNNIKIPNKTQNMIINEKSQNVKPIRYIIPYTTQQKPSPFRAKNLRNNKNDTATGFSEWSPLRTYDQEIDTQESSIVTATAPIPTPTIKTTKYIAKFLASSIKELLNKEKIESFTTDDINSFKETTEEIEINTGQSEGSTYATEKETNREEIVPFDFTTFQENINKWTEEQFGSTSKAATTTIEMVKYTKPIPIEYITESLLLPKITIATSSPVTTVSPPTKTLQSKHRTTYSDSLDSALIDRLKSSFKFAKAYSSKSAHRNHAEQWKKVQVSISPLTKEKIYIVTPQTYVSETDIVEAIPRFKKRPTPGKRTLS